jgi:hypothetical protein
MQQFVEPAEPNPWPVKGYSTELVERYPLKLKDLQRQPPVTLGHPAGPYGIGV